MRPPHRCEEEEEDDEGMSALMSASTRSFSLQLLRLLLLLFKSLGPK